MQPQWLRLHYVPNRHLSYTLSELLRISIVNPRSRNMCYQRRGVDINRTSSFLQNRLPILCNKAPSSTLSFIVSLWRFPRLTMKLTIKILILCSLSFVAATNYSFHGGFDRTVCYPLAISLFNNGTLPSGDEVFFRGDDGQPMSCQKNMTLTLPSYRRIYGQKQAWYWDIGPRLSTWLIPTLLLLTNIELSPLDKRRFMALIHFLGDPIDSIWSLLHQIDA